MVLLDGCAKTLIDDESNSDNNGSDENYNQVPGFGSDSTFSVVTWNIENFPKHPIYTNTYLAKIIVDLNVNVIGFQEIYSTSEFNQLIDEINDLDSLYGWIGFRSEESENPALAYIINTSMINIIDVPYLILNEFNYFFAWRNPYVIKVSYMNNEYIIINNHYKCCGNGIIENDDDDEEYRRQQASLYLKNYIDNNFPNDNIIIIGDMNDELVDEDINNVFLCFIEDDDDYQFLDIEIAYGPSSNWSFPNYPSHLDHILITNELFIDFDSPVSYVQTIQIENYFVGGWGTYENLISDHRPVGLNLFVP